MRDAHYAGQAISRRTSGNLIHGGRWLVFAPLTPIGFGLARLCRAGPLFFQLYSEYLSARRYIAMLAQSRAALCGLENPPRSPNGERDEEQPDQDRAEAKGYASNYLPSRARPRE